MNENLYYDKWWDTVVRCQSGAWDVYKHAVGLHPPIIFDTLDIHRFVREILGEICDEN